MNKKIKVIVGVVTLLVIVGFAITRDSNGVGNDPVKIGLISILSGEYSVVGENLRNGAILAQEQYNAMNPDSPVELVIEDDGFDSKKGLSAYKKLVDLNNIDALINVSSPTIGAIYGSVVEKGFPVLQMGEQTIEPARDNVFQLMPGNIEAEIELGKTIRDYGYKNPSVVYTNNDTMVRFTNAVIEGYGSEITKFVLDPNATDYRSDALKVASADSDVLIILTFPQQGAQFIKAYLAVESSPARFAFDPGMQSGFADYERILGGMSMLENSIVVAVEQTLNDVFVEEYKERFGVGPGFFSDLGYDAFNLLIETQNSNQGKWVKNIENTNVVGAAGLIQFNSEGVRSPDVKITEIINGKIDL